MLFKLLPVAAIFAALLPAGFCQLTTAQLTTFRSAMLARTNLLRAKHGSPAVILQANPSNTAQDWANHMAATNVFAHSGQPGGENLYMAGGGSAGYVVPGEHPAQKWYDEIIYYSWFGGEPNMSTFNKYGHFTALVWKSVDRIDVGYAKNGTKHYVVCRYYPRANVIGAFGANVLAPIARKIDFEEESFQELIL